MRTTLPLISILVWSSFATGDTAAPKPPAKATACKVCHLSTNPAAEVPHLAGQRVGYLTKQLKAFKAGDRKNDLMTAIAAQLTDADINELAAYWSAQPAGSDVVVPAEIAALKLSKMSFPPKFPAGFTVYRTQVEEQVVARSYVNAPALQAARAGKPLPSGSIIIVANYAAKLDANKHPIKEGDGYAVGEALSYSGMEVRTGWGAALPELLRNGNWHYNVFGADKRPQADLNQAVCLGCHKPVAANDYVFTIDTIRDLAKKPHK